MPKSLLIALDYDNTYTADPSFWDSVIALGSERGHRFMCVTARRETVENMNDVVVGDLLVVFTSLAAKHNAVEDLGFAVDIWIDDDPYSITRGH